MIRKGGGGAHLLLFFCIVKGVNTMYEYRPGDMLFETASGQKFVMGYEKDDDRYYNYLNTSTDATDPCVRLAALQRQGQALVDEFDRCARLFW